MITMIIIIMMIIMIIVILIVIIIMIASSNGNNELNKQHTTTSPCRPRDGRFSHLVDVISRPPCEAPPAKDGLSETEWDCFELS